MAWRMGRRMNGSAKYLFNVLMFFSSTKVRSVFIQEKEGMKGMEDLSGRLNTLTPCTMYVSPF
jgi:hypothetical protein